MVEKRSCAGIRDGRHPAVRARRELEDAVDYVISPEAISIQPYGIMLRKGDPAFKKVADNAIVAVFKSGEIDKIYAKWFLSPIPPKNINLNVPMSDQLKNVIANPTDSGDPAAYK